jgi:hypothetical protein
MDFLPENAARKKKCADSGFAKDNFPISGGGLAPDETRG